MCELIIKIKSSRYGVPNLRQFEILLVLISLMIESSMMDKLNPVEVYVSILWLSRTHIADKLRSQGAVLLKHYHGPLG